MRPEEIFALEKLVTVTGGSYRGGEDPPDAYIDLPGRVLAVERLAGDCRAGRLMSELIEQFEDRVPIGKTLFLIISAPLNNAQKIRAELELHIQEVLGLGYANRIINMNGDGASITITDSDSDAKGQIEYAISNENVSADISENLTYSLSERISAKKHLPQKNHGGDEYWLCILSEIWLANSHSIQLTYNELSESHGYDQIYVVHGHGEVQQLINSVEVSN